MIERRGGEGHITVLLFIHHPTIFPSPFDVSLAHFQFHHRQFASSNLPQLKFPLDSMEMKRHLMM
jgi:hypothetical protein